jgi:hypothetical protein
MPFSKGIQYSNAPALRLRSRSFKFRASALSQRDTATKAALLLAFQRSETRGETESAPACRRPHSPQSVDRRSADRQRIGSLIPKSNQ